MKVVVLVPWRPGDPLREWNWEVTRPYLERLGWPLYLGDREGPWSRAAACNEAARTASEWDVAVVADADTIPENRAVRTAVDVAAGIRGAARPHDRLWRLTQRGSRVFAALGPSAMNKTLTSGTHLGGGMLVISREAFEAVGGYDERFVGWGHEDSAMGLSLVTEASWARVPGNAWHLFHPAPSKDTPERHRNWALMEEKRAEPRTERALERASLVLGFDVGKVL